MSRFIKSFLQFTLLSVIVAGCTAVPIKTIYNLARADLMTLDPSIFRAAVRIPDILEPRSDAAKLSISMKVKDKDPVSEEFILEIVSAPEELEPLQSEKRKGDSIWIYQINPEDLTRLNEFRKSAKSIKSTYGRKAKGSVSVGIGACHRNGIPDGKLPMSNWLRIDRASGYLPTLVDYDLKDALAAGKQSDLPPC